MDECKSGENGSASCLCGQSAGLIIHMCRRCFLPVCAGQALHWLNIMRQQHSSPVQLPARGHLQVKTIFSPLTPAEKHTSRPTLMHLCCILMKSFSRNEKRSCCPDSLSSPLVTFSLLWFGCNTKVCINPIIPSRFLFLMRRPVKVVS